jgi:hypothetical protein
VNATKLRITALIAVLTAFSGCTRIKEVPAPATSVEPAGSPVPDESPPTPFPSAATPSPSPTPTPVPAPVITLLEPTSATDFSGTAIDVVFTATPAAGRKLKGATFYYDGRPLLALEGEGPTFRVEDWDPNVQNSLVDPPVTEPVRSGEHTIAIAATDDQGVEGKIEIGIFKQLKITGWTELASMPNPTSHHAAFSDGAAPPSFVSIWGSVDGIETTVIPRPNVYGFSPVGDGKWTTLAINGSSVPRAGYASAVHPSGQLFYLAGGRTANQDLRSVDVYAPLRKVAEQAPVSLNVARSDAFGAVVDDHFYVFGGKSAGAALYSVERVKIEKDGNPGAAFDEVATMQNARAGGTALVQGKEIWVFGGGHRPIEVYDTTANAWRFLTDPAGTTIGTPEAWSHALMVPVNSRVYFFGGTKEDGQAVDRIYEFDPTTKAWRELGPMPSITGEDPATRPLTRVAGFFHEGAFYLLGGQTLPGKQTSARVFRGTTL